MSNSAIDIAACRSRQQRLLEQMQRLELDLVVVQTIEHVQWLAGPRFGWVYQPAAALTADGRLTLVAPNQPPERAAADHIVTYEAQWHCTLRNDQRQAAAESLKQAIGSLPAHVGVEFSVASRHLPWSDSAVDIEPTMFALRRRKDLDELDRIRQAIAGTEKMYQLAREIIAPGMGELEVFNRLQAAAVEQFGEMLTGTGNDYQCGSKGGPPRQGRKAQNGELYILDLGPAYQGYFADNARTIAVGHPTDEQQQAWQYVMQVFQYLESHVKPGVRAGEVFRHAQAILDQAPIGVFDHHLGHGIGLFPHETPHLNPAWDDEFQVGDVFTAEPGLYADALRAGMRIENDYLVTEEGIENLSPFPMQLERA